MTAFLTSLGDTAYMLGNKDIDSQESDIFDVDNDSSNDDTIDMIIGVALSPIYNTYWAQPQPGRKQGKKTLMKARKKKLTQKQTTTTATTK
jgi:hypothetical protein